MLTIGKCLKNKNVLKIDLKIYTPECEMSPFFKGVTIIFIAMEQILEYFLNY